MTQSEMTAYLASYVTSQGNQGAISISNLLTALIAALPVSGSAVPLTGTAAPSAKPSYVGQIYVDTTNVKVYVAKGVAASSDWKQITLAA